MLSILAAIEIETLKDELRAIEKERNGLSGELYDLKKSHSELWKAYEDVKKDRDLLRSLNVALTAKHKKDMDIAERVFFENREFHRRLAACP